MLLDNLTLYSFAVKVFVVWRFLLNVNSSVRLQSQYFRRRLVTYRIALVCDFVIASEHKNNLSKKKKIFLRFYKCFFLEKL